METVHQPGEQEHQNKAGPSLCKGLQHLRALFSLVLLTLSLVMGQIMLQLALAADHSAEPALVQAYEFSEAPPEYVLAPSSDPSSQEQRSLFANIPQANHAPLLTTLNYQEDRAIREAILARPARWETDACSSIARYTASNALQVFLGNPHCPSTTTAPPAINAQHEHTLLTARILLGLWYSRRDDARFSRHGAAAFTIDEILQWRGVQKHQRIAYPGTNKRFSDGYQWKQRQQVLDDLHLLQQYYLRGFHNVMIQGKVARIPVDSPYLHITPVGTLGYVVAPGNWLASYEQHDTIFTTTIDRRMLQLHPQNDQIALRLAFYLSEHWRLHARSGRYQQPLLMADLLAASMLPVDKANLTSRFAPRVEAALQKLYTLGILGEPPTNLTPIDTSKVQWGKDWLASYWTLLPPHASPFNMHTSI